MDILVDSLSEFFLISIDYKGAIITNVSANVVRAVVTIFKSDTFDSINNV